MARPVHPSLYVRTGGWRFSLKRLLRRSPSAPPNKIRV